MLLARIFARLSTTTMLLPKEIRFPSMYWSPTKSSVDGADLQVSESDGFHQRSFYKYPINNSLFPWLPPNPADVSYSKSVSPTTEEMAPAAPSKDEGEAKVTSAMLTKNVLYAAMAIAGVGLILNYLFRWIRWGDRTDCLFHALEIKRSEMKWVWLRDECKAEQSALLCITRFDLTSYQKSNFAFISFSDSNKQSVNQSINQSINPSQSIHFPFSTQHQFPRF